MENKTDSAFHGSDLEKIEKVYGINKDEIISFSANVNPLGISHELSTELGKNISVIERYPDREYTGLREAIGSYCGTSWKNIIVGNGSSELIASFTKLKKGAKAMIIGPTYSEYARGISVGQGTAVYYELKEADGFKADVEDIKRHLSSELDILIICNPNNPTSGAIKKDELGEILDDCLEKHIFVMVDETYIEFAENSEDIEAIPFAEMYDNLFVIRGVSKFFAAPGLRLGYAVTGNAMLRDRITQNMEPWSVSSLAEYAGRVMFTDKEYIEKTKKYISDERNRVCAALDKFHDAGIHYYEPSANFVLCRIMNARHSASELFDICIKEKMMIRNCATFPFLNDSYFRFCFMNPEDDDRLLAVIGEVMV